MRALVLSGKLPLGRWGRVTSIGHSPLPSASTADLSRPAQQPTGAPRYRLAPPPEQEVYAGTEITGP